MSCQEIFNLFQAFVAHEHTTGTQDARMNTKEGTTVKVVIVVMLGISFCMCPSQTTFFRPGRNRFLLSWVFDVPISLSLSWLLNSLCLIDPLFSDLELSWV